MNNKHSIAASLFFGILSSQILFAEPLRLDANNDVTLSPVTDQLLELQTSNKTLSTNTFVSSMTDDTSVVSIDAINVHSQMLDGSKQTFNINLGSGRVLPVELSKSYWINSRYQAWTGEVNAGTQTTLNAQSKTTGEYKNRAVFVHNKGRVFGQINVEGQVFEIMTAENGQQMLVERDFSQLATEDDTPEQELPTQTTLSTLVDESIRAVAAPSTIRVLQVASTNAINRFGANNVVDRMNFFIAQANDVYANNGLQLTLQDAGKYNSGRSELSSVTANTIAIRAPNDGYLDNFAGSLRNSTGADIVAHITDNNGDGLCGRVNAIGGGQANGFFVTRHICTNFTFVHEIGHLFGARHDNDPTTTPFAFGHGFVNRGANIRTVMAVSSNPQPRVGYFSTDDQTRNGATLGNANFADNERVHDIRRGVLANFR